ncbi:MAG: hypothetical protein KDC80_13920 [Saprospiraceae bacterium]|nr:hypothetical protein [Saprospiraceae bacterium]
MLSKEKILELAEVHDTICVSLYMSVHKKGTPVLNRENQLEFKSLLNSVKEVLISRLKSKKEIEAFVSPLTNLLKDDDFWRNQQAGLAVFLNRNRLQYFLLPDQVRNEYYISSHFRLWPLLSFTNRSGEFHLVALNLDQVRAYKASRFQMEEILRDKLGQVKFEEIVGTDYEQKYLQFHSQQSGFDQSHYHGLGEGKDDTKKEQLQYFRKIDNVIMSALKSNSTPVLLTGLDHFIGLFKQVSKLPNLMPQHLPGNAKGIDIHLLQERAWKIMHPYFEQKNRQLIDQIAESMAKGKSSSNTDEILESAVEGRVDKLLIADQEDIWGIYNPSQKEVKIDNTHTSHNISLTNLAAMQTLIHGGEVYVTSRESLPPEDLRLYALYRY